MAEAKCPGTCGELLQGWISGSEKLISCPIDLYSYISIKEGVQQKPAMPLIEQAASLTLSYLGIDKDYRRALNIEHSSDLPIGKGYASSTADISATIVALCRHLNMANTQEFIAKLASSLEPSDSVMLQGLALIDHNTGDIEKSYPLPCSSSVLILEPTNTVLTRDFHELERKGQLLESEHNLNSALKLFEQGISACDTQLIGKASTISATEHHKSIEIPYFSQILSSVEHHDLYGLCIAHSGSIIGLLYDEFQHDIERLVSDLKRKKVLETYNTQRQVRMISGGVI